MIKRGRMTVEEHAEIDRLADELQNPTPGRIARRLNRNVSTIKWYMLTHGLIDDPVRYGPPSYTTKSGKIVNPYKQEHDARITELRTQGLKYREIAEIVTREFGVPRNAHSVQVRITMLAAYRDAA